MIKTVIFDLDGTLLDTLQDLHNAVNYALELHGYPTRTLDEIRRFIGNGVKKLMERSLPQGTDEKTQKICLDCFRSYYLQHMRDNTCAYDGIIELLTFLKEKGVYIAVVSNKLHPAVAELCEDYFKGLPDAAIGVTVEAERKPAPVNLLKAISMSSNSAEETIYVGDSEVDIQASHNAGLKCICVTWGFRSKTELLRHGADFIADTTDEVLGIISNN